MKSVKIHRISIDSLALSVIASGCRVEDLFFDLEIRKRLSPTAISAKALHAIYDPLISVDPKCCVTGMALQSPQRVWANFKERAKRLYPLRYWPRERRGNSAQRTAARRVDYKGIPITQH